MLLSAITIFLSAFLLFLLQPVMAKQILPWFGGSATVWTTCLVFFQSALLAGYAYSDLAVRRFGPRGQARLHIALLLLSLAVLPIVPAAHWKPSGDENPLWLILGMLTLTIGLPYFLLSTTSPLVQYWFARARLGANPYRLFALSNLASMLALVGYPFLLEPWIPTRTQALGWSLGYLVFVMLCATLAWVSMRRAAKPVMVEVSDHPAGAAHAIDDKPPTRAQQALWCGLAATGSLLLLAVSNHITQNIAAVPLLWIVPLSIYLLTFILCFDTKGWYIRHLFLALLAGTLGVMAWALANPRLTHQLGIQVGTFCGGLFVACMFCHGELARLKPAPKHLTRFYLMISLGGAGGSVLVGIVAPLVLPAYFELAIGLIVCGLLLVGQSRRNPLVYPAVGVVATFFAVGCAIWGLIEFYDSTIVATRNFYGVLRVQESTRGDNIPRRHLMHGTILHGTQYFAAEFLHRPTTYYTPSSGIGRLLEAMHPRIEPMRVGMIGLGAGTLATYGSKGDVYRIYDINPAVIGIANRNFTFLKDSEATIETPLGDARLKLESEPPQNFDVLAIDAFSSDAIPVHLITSEAVAIYKRHIKPGGVIAFHVTNRFLDLVPVVGALAKANGLNALHIADDGGEDGFASRSDWVLLSENDELLAMPALANFATPIQAHPEWRLWTDDFNNLVQVLK